MVQQETSSNEIRGLWYCLMVTLELCKKILNSGKRKYADCEIKEIREFLYRMAELQIESEKEKNNLTKKKKR